MKVSYHSHSEFCRHGQGKMEEYVKEAIAHHLELFAICEHTPMDNRPKGARASWKDYPAYIKEAERLEKEYGKDIKLIRSFEAEYFPEMMDTYRRMKKEDHISVWILGQHESADHNVDYYDHTDPQEKVRRYTEDVLNGLETEFFDVLAHPDLIMMYYDKPTPFVMECMDKIFRSCEKHHVIVEINANGLRGNKGYPNKEIFELSKKYDLRYIVGSDAHKPSALCDTFVSDAYEFCKELGIKPIDFI